MDETDVLGLWAVAVTGACFEIVCILEAFRHRRKAKRMRDIPTSKIGEITDGYREIKGRVAAADRAKMLTAPLSGKRCVYYKFKVSQASEGDGTVISDVRGAVCCVDDDTGVASIDLKGAELVLDFDRIEASGTGRTNRPDSEFKAILAKYNETNVGLFGGERALGYYETILEEGDELYVLGPVKVIEGRVCFKATGGQRLIVSEKSERALLAKENATALRFTLGAVLLPVVAGVVALLIYLNR